MNAKDIEYEVYASYMNIYEYLKTHKGDDEVMRHPQYTGKLLELCGNPDKATKNIIVTGSKGKGSVSVMIAKLLEAHGYKVGLFTSPHLVDFRERIRINGKAISEKELVEYGSIVLNKVNEVQKLCKENEYIGPVGISCVIAALYFKECKTDINIFECGRGARFDDVNQIKSDISVINRIFYEHWEQLGDTIERIAYHKSGVIKNGQQACFSTKQNIEVEKVLKDIAQKENVPLFTYGKDMHALNIRYDNNHMLFDYKGKTELNDLTLSMLGEHQCENAALALSVTEEICTLNKEKVQNVFNHLHWFGRMETLKKEPLVILDGCINKESAERLLPFIKTQKDITFVIGIPADKDYQGVLQTVLPYAKNIISADSANRFLHFEKDQKTQYTKLCGNVPYTHFEHMEECLNSLKDCTNTIIILGTQSIIGETKKYFKQSTLDI